VYVLTAAATPSKAPDTAPTPEKNVSMSAWLVDILSSKTACLKPSFPVRWNSNPSCERFVKAPVPL